MTNKLNVIINQCENGFVIIDENTGKTYVANRLDSYSILDVTVKTVLQSLMSDIGDNHAEGL